MEDKKKRLDMAKWRALNLFIEGDCSFDYPKLKKFISNIKFSDSDIVYDFSDEILKHLKEFLDDTSSTKQLDELKGFTNIKCSRKEIQKLFGVNPKIYWIDYPHKTVYRVDDTEEIKFF